MSGCLHKFVREGYYGGRVEVFREGFTGSETSVLNYGDVNSMYPWAMLGDMPTELAFVRKGWIDVDRARKKYLGFVRCTVDVPTTCYLPPLPYRTTGKLVFPVGCFSGTWTTAELELLPMVGGRIHDIQGSVWFRGRKVFTNYVNYWYAFRDKTKKSYDLSMDMIAKLFLNSLYGKMGMNSEREKLWFYPTDEEFDNHKLVPLNPLMPQSGAYVEKTNSEPSYVIPHIAAWVTARSRARLWTLMFGFVSKGYRLYYCDTDSIVTNGPIEDSSALGDLKTVCQIKRAKFVAPKMYFIEQTDGKHFIKAKGFSGGFGAKSLSEQEFNQIIEHREKVGIQRMRKMREGLRSNERFPSMLTARKGVRSGVLDEKRIHLPDGNTQPINAKDLTK